MAPITDIKALNAHLADHSYVGGSVPSGDDLKSFEAVKVPGKDLVHALRWYNHIKSFGKAETSKWGAGSSAAADDDEDEDVDLFGDDDEEDEEKERIKQERLAAYAAKKSKKPALIAKSSIILDVKPWEAETDMAAMEKDIRSIAMDGLVWGAGKLVPVAYGVKKLQIMCVVEDEKVSIDSLTEQIEGFEDFVQSVDIAAFNKVIRVQF